MKFFLLLLYMFVLNKRNNGSFSGSKITTYLPFVNDMFMLLSFIRKTCYYCVG